MNTRFLLIGSVLTLLCFTNICFSQVTFIEHVIDDHEYGASSVCSADFNGDGFPDVVASGNDINRISYYQNNGTSPVMFTKIIIDNAFIGSIYVDAADVNGDGFVDILGAGWNGNEIACWYNDGGNPITWIKASIDNSFNGAHEVHTADIDGDGDIDVLGASAENHQIAYWENDGSNPVNWTKKIVGTQFNGARSVIGCDVNNDGFTDIIGAALISDQVAVWLNDGNNPITWTKEIVDNAFDGAHWVHGVDFDGDGDIDIFGAAAIGSIVSWWRNDGGSPISWTKQNIDNNFAAVLSVATADLDGDGDLDAFGAATAADAVRWWRNDGGDPVQWTRINISTTFDEAWGLFGADIDNDGDTDVLATAATDNEVTWWENTITTGIEENKIIPSNFKLTQNYPNPFNPSTTIIYSILNVGTRHVVSVKLTIYDLLGKEICTLVNEEKSPGTYQVEFDATNLTSGIYFYSLSAGQFNEVRKMTLMK